MTARTLLHQKVILPWLWMLLGGLVAIGVAMVPLALFPWLVLLGIALVLPLIDPVFGVYMAVLSVPVQDVVRLPGGLSYTQAAVAWTVGAWLVRVLAHPEQPLVFDRMFWLWFGLLWALLLAAVVTPYSQQVALTQTSRWLVAFVVWFIAVQTVRQRWQVVGLVACLLIAPASEAVLGLFQFVRGDGPASFRIAANLPYIRAYGTIGTPNPFAGYLNMGWPLAVALAVYVLQRTIDDRRWTMDSGWRTIGYRLSVIVGMWIVVLVLLLGLVASFSRGGWLGAVFGIVGMTLVLGRRTARVVLVGAILAVLVVLLGGVGLLPAALSTRIASVAGSFALSDPSVMTVTPQNFAVVERMAQMWAGV